MAEKILNARDAKLVQWLNEAYAKESELGRQTCPRTSSADREDGLQEAAAHAPDRDARPQPPRGGADQEARRLGQRQPGPGRPGAGRRGRRQGRRRGQGPGRRRSGRVTPQPETHLRNAQEELREEQVEIALYTRIETLANEVGDNDTAQAGKSHPA